MQNAYFSEGEMVPWFRIKLASRFERADRPTRDQLLAMTLGHQLVDARDLVICDAAENVGDR